MIHPFPSGLDLLPCPVCGKPAELYEADEETDDSVCYVVFCQDTHCAGNCSPSRSTADEAISAWNEQAAHSNFRWYKSCCPACGWSDPDFPQPKWKNADVVTYGLVFGVMNVMWLRIYCQAVGIAMSLLQNIFYAVPFTLLFLLPSFFVPLLIDRFLRQQK